MASHMRRGLSAGAGPGSSAVLSKWLKGWNPTPPVAYTPGSEPPTALSWLRRRGPGLPIAAIHRLFREETVRVFEPQTGQVTRASRTKALKPGSLLLLPKGLAVAEVGEEAAAPAYTPEQQRLRALWVRRLRGRLLYDGADFLAIDKPAGLAVQGAFTLRVLVC